MKEQLRNIALATTIAFSGAGAVGGTTLGQSEAEADPRQQSTEVMEELNVAPFLEAVRERIDYDAEPKFFKQMEQRAKTDSDKYFTRTETPDGYSIAYYPDGLTGDIQMQYIHSLSNGVGNDVNGVPAGVNYFMRHDEVTLELGKDGTLNGNNGIDLFNFEEIKANLENYYNESKILADSEWVEVDANPASPAVVFKQFKDDKDNYIWGGTQRGYMTHIHQVIEIPRIGTDEVVN